MRGGEIAVLVEKYSQAFDYSLRKSENLLTLKQIDGNGHNRGCLLIIAYYCPPTKNLGS